MPLVRYEIGRELLVVLEEGAVRSAERDLFFVSSRIPEEVEGYEVEYDEDAEAYETVLHDRIHRVRVGRGKSVVYDVFTACQ
jgi:hypothetical protein